MCIVKIAIIDRGFYLRNYLFRRKDRSLFSFFFFRRSLKFAKSCRNLVIVSTLLDTFPFVIAVPDRAPDRLSRGGMSILKPRSIWRSNPPNHRMLRGRERNCVLPRGGKTSQNWWHRECNCIWTDTVNIAQLFLPIDAPITH